jgi:ribosomal-protein-serine acetyltransferase
MSMSPPSRLASGPLVLRRWTLDDVTTLAAAVIDSVHHLRPWMPWAADEPIDLEARRAIVRTWSERWDAGTDFTYGMWAEGTVVGGCGLHARLPGPGLEIGYWVHAGHVRRGYATAAAAGLTSAAFEVPELAYVEIHHDKANIASGRVPPALGFIRIGEERRERRAPLESGTTVLWRMRRETWLARDRQRTGD